MLLEGLHRLVVGLVLGGEGVLIVLLLVGLHFREALAITGLGGFRVGFRPALGLLQLPADVLQVGLEDAALVSGDQGADERAQQDTRQGGDDGSDGNCHSVKVFVNVY